MSGMNEDVEIKREALLKHTEQAYKKVGGAERLVFRADDLERDEVARVAEECFGIPYLFPWQRLVIQNVLDAFFDEERETFGKQIVLLPTGAGKSLCFQIPAVLLPGATLIIYPLVALMNDQARRMAQAGLECVVFKGGQSQAEREECFRRIASGVRLILANPEVLASASLVDRLALCGLCHVAIDEAHCVSEWGDTFRPAYLELGRILKRLCAPVVTAFTATASPQVLSRVSEVLFDGGAHLVRSESDRPNLRYYVRHVGSKKKAVLMLAATEARPMIVFCAKRRRAEDMAQELNTAFNRTVARFYHAGLEKAEKEAVERWFFDSEDGILCATCAYGMGVDKKNIRTVVHLDAPLTAEAYIQEAGRGGRDGELSNAILLWAQEDRVRFSAFGAGSRSAAMRVFAQTSGCRRQVLLDALGAEKAVCSGCDNCEAASRRAQNKADGVIKTKRCGAWARLCKKISGSWHNQKTAFFRPVGFTFFARMNALYESVLPASASLQGEYPLCSTPGAAVPDDMLIARSLIALADGYFCVQQFERLFCGYMNRLYRMFLGVNVWNHDACMEVLDALRSQGVIYKPSLKKLARLRLVKDKKLAGQRVSRFLRRASVIVRLRRLRLHRRLFPQRQELRALGQERALPFSLGVLAFLYSLRQSSKNSSCRLRLSSFLSRWDSR